MEKKEQTRHMNEKDDFLPERIITAEMTGLNEKQVKSFLIRGITHSEIRMGRFENGVFKPGDFQESLIRKKECKNIPIITTIGKEVKKIEEARDFAGVYHQGQIYGEYDYLYHLDQVVSIATNCELPEIFIIACYLHDILENTTCKYKEIKERFGEDVADMVYACTDELGRNRKEKKEKTYDKLKHMQNGVIVKLCDRIANCNFSSKNSKKKALMYLEESPAFETLYDRNSFFSFNNIDNLYGKYKKLWELYYESIEKIRLSLTQ